MALKQILLRKKLDQRSSDLKGYQERKAKLKLREEETEEAAKEAETEEEIAAVEEEIDKLEEEKKEIDEKIGDLEAEIKELEEELRSMSEKNPSSKRSESQVLQERKDGNAMSMRMAYKGMTREAINEVVNDERSKQFLESLRSVITEKRSVKSVDLTIPDVYLPMLRRISVEVSKLIGKVNSIAKKGTTRQNVEGVVPEGVWMETKGALNELEFGFKQIEIDGFKVGGFITIDNSDIEDSDEDLIAMIVENLGKSIGKALDKAIIYGTGIKMPLGIVNRLKQTSKPDDYPDDSPEWEDLHITHIKKLITTGKSLFSDIIMAMADCKNEFTNGERFWCMNSKTHAMLTVEMLNFNANGALVSTLNNTMPIVGGEIIELEFIPDGDIIGGYPDMYTLVEREGTKIVGSDIPLFLHDKTVFKGTARYDGKPVIAEAFILLNIKNENPTTEADFEIDYANTELGSLAVTSTANSTTSGKTDITIGGGENSGTTFGYKIAGKVVQVKCGDSNVGFTEIESGDSITAATGKHITVVEFDASGRAIKVGSSQVIAKA